MIKEKRRQKKRRKIGLIVALNIIALLAVAALVAWNLFTVETVEVDGNELYPDKMIRTSILNDDYSWNTLYVYVKYKFNEPEEIPFIDAMDITMTSVHGLKITVYEKGIVGYVKVKSTGQNAYFDKDGIVVEVSSATMEDVTYVSGIDFEEVVLYETLPVEDKSVFKSLLSLSQSLKKYELKPDSISVNQNQDFVLKYGTIKVVFGDCDNLNDKVVRLQKIMPQLNGMKGTLHMEEWKDDSSDITFEKKNEKK